MHHIHRLHAAAHGQLTAERALAERCWWEGCGSPCQAWQLAHVTGVGTKER
jgi:hypothetical protein